jgi:hypothetical protein
MGTAKKRKRPTITFEPDEDVAKELAKIEEIMGKARGLRTAYINDALRNELPHLIRRKVDAWQRHLSTEQKPNK